VARSFEANAHGAQAHFRRTIFRGFVHWAKGCGMPVKAISEAGLQGLSMEILRDLGMSEQTISAYLRRYRHDGPAPSPPCVRLSPEAPREGAASREAAKPGAEAIDGRSNGADCVRRKGHSPMDAAPERGQHSLPRRPSSQGESHGK
jgi:hypothetical protein